MSATVEDRLRAALAARADQVTAGGLQPATPPSRRAVRRPWSRVQWAPALAGLAVAAVVVVFAVVLAWRPAHPSLPADVPPPAPVPSVPASPANPQPTPSASAATRSPAVATDEPEPVITVATGS